MNAAARERTRARPRLFAQGLKLDITCLTLIFSGMIPGGQDKFEHEFSV
jgi:hypothetical protein